MAEQPIAVVDAHAHFWSAHPDAARYVHPTDEPINPAGLVRLMDDAAVDRTLQVTRVFADDADSVRGALEHPSRFRVLGRPGGLVFEEEDAWQAWQARPGLVGMRLFAVPFDVRLFGPERSAFWHRVARDRVPVSIYAPGHLPDLLRLAGDRPDVTFVLDHAGARVAHDVPGDARLQEWPLLADAAALPNVAVKASALPEATDEHAPPYSRATELLLELVALFGADRVMWGSNYTPAARSGSYRQLVEHARSAAGQLPDADAAAVLGGTALRHFPDRAAAPLPVR